MTTYTPEAAAKFCALIADGASVCTACKKPGMPSKATVFKWLGEHTEFVKMYEVATDERADTHVEEIVDIADNCKTDKASIQKARLRIYARESAAARMKPRKYGAKVQLTGEGGGAIETRSSLDVSGLSTTALAEIMRLKDETERR